MISDSILALSKRPGVRPSAVINFLSTLRGNKVDAVQNLKLDARLYRWNDATVEAIKEGIEEHFKRDGVKE